MSDDDEPRTYGIWGFAALFVVLGAVGLAAFLLFGNTKGDTVQLPAVSSTTEPGTTLPDPDGTAAPITVPGGAPAPDGVREVVSSNGATSYAFDVPEDLAQNPLVAQVAPATAVPTADDSSLDITITCAKGAGEALAQLSITEDPTTVTILPVVLVPADAPPCVAGGVLEQVSVPLVAPLGGRQIVFVPPGTSVPTPTSG